MMWWLIILFLQSDGLHWDARCMLPYPQGPPLAMEYMLVPSNAWRAAVDSAGPPDSYVDSILNLTFQSAAKRHNVICRPLTRHYSQEHIDEGLRWPIRRYEPQVGWFLWRECGPSMDWDNVGTG